MFVILSVVLSLIFLTSSSSFWGFWLGMEMYNFFFTPWLMEEENYKKSSKIFFYFIVQVMASGGFLLGMSNYDFFFFYILLLGSMIVKLGGFPFHVWVLKVVENMKWIKFSLFLTISKIGPIVVMAYINPLLSLIKFVWGGTIIPIFGLKTSSVRLMLTYSSIAYMSWIITALCLSKSLLLFFVVSYWMIFYCTCLIFDNFMIKSVKDFFGSSFPYLGVLMILSLMGFPPFLGFFPKLFVLKFMCTESMVLESILLSIFSAIPYYLYLKMILTVSLKFSFSNYSFLPLRVGCSNIFFHLVILLFGLEILMYTCM